MEFSAKQIAEFIQGEIIGDENATVHTFAKIEEGMPGAISFLSNPKYTPYIYSKHNQALFWLTRILLLNMKLKPLLSKWKMHTKVWRNCSISTK